MIEPILPTPEGQRSEVALRPWVKPELRTMQAGSAEMPGPNPNNPEGAFASGS